MAQRILPRAGQAEKAVLYLRMSDERQEHSIPAQRQELLRYAEKHGYQVLREYLDQGISGDDTGSRVGFGNGLESYRRTARDRLGREHRTQASPSLASRPATRS